MVPGRRNYQGHTVLAEPAIVAYQATDAAILSLLGPTQPGTSVSTTAGMSSTLTSTSPTTTVPSPTTNRPLTTGGKIAIGITVPIGFLAMIGLLFFCVRRRRHSQGVKPGAQGGTEMRQTKAELDGTSIGRPRAELEGS